MREVTLVRDPTIIPIFQMEVMPEGMEEFYKWLGQYRPECLPEPPEGEEGGWLDLFPHGGVELKDGQERLLTGNELLVEFAGRKCYDSFGTKAGRKTNADYIDHTQQGVIPHRSIKYHAKMTFFISGISWRVSHEFIRNYVGSDRDQEGSPSEESTRYTFHPGHFVIHPRDIEEGNVEWFRESMQASYDRYCQYVDSECRKYQERTGSEPKGMDRKRIYEASAGYIPKQVSTSLVWTTNPEALKKLFLERTDNSTDLEFQRFAKKWQKLCCAKWPNLFPKVG